MGRCGAGKGFICEWHVGYTLERGLDGLMVDAGLRSGAKTRYPALEISQASMNGSMH